MGDAFFFVCDFNFPHFRIRPVGRLMTPSVVGAQPEHTESDVAFKNLTFGTDFNQNFKARVFSKQSSHFDIWQWVHTLYINICILKYHTKHTHTYI